MTHRSVPARVQDTLPLPHAQFVPTQPRWHVSPAQTRIGEALTTSLAVAEATEVVHAAGAAIVGRMHERTAQIHAQTATAIVAPTLLPRPERARQAIDEFADAQLSMLHRHQLGLLEAGAYAVATEANRSLYPQPEKPGLLRRLFGGG
jgi:hypothetical protein